MDIEEQIDSLNAQTQSLKAMKKDQAKADKLAASEQREQQRQAIQDAIKTIIADHDYRFIRGQNAYAEYGPGGWSLLNKQALQSSHAELQSSEGLRVFTTMLAEQGRIHRDITASFDVIADDLLNLVDRSTWVQPVAGEVHPFFDLLTWSLSGQNTEAQSHIEHVVARKVLHPDEYTIPCMVFYPQGGTGKNILSDNVLATMFGPHQVATVDTAKVSGTFNGMVAGKTVVFIDESQNDKLDMEAMKRLVGNRQIVINEKFQRPYQVSNTALYIVGGNDARGAIRLGHDHSDRRWSVIKADRQLADVIAEKLGLSLVDAKSWIADHIWVTRDPVEVGRWLHRILGAHKDKGIPQAYHGDDFTDLAAAQRPAWEMVAEVVFSDPDLTYISPPKMHDLVAAYVRKSYPNSRVPNIQDLRTYVTGWLSNHPELGFNAQTRKVNLTDILTGRTVSSANAWVRGDAGSCVKLDVTSKWLNHSGWIDEEDRINASQEDISDKIQRFKRNGLSLVG